MEITLINETNQSFFEPFMKELPDTKIDFCFGAIEGDCACGILAADVEDTILQIKYLYVAEEMRRRGAAAALLEAVDETAAALRMDAVVCQFTKIAEEPGFDELLQMNGYLSDEQTSIVYVTNIADIQKDVLEKAKNRVMNGEFYDLNQVTRKIWNSLKNNVLSEVEEDRQPAFRELSAYDQESSFVYVEKEVPVGCILVSRNQQDYILEYLYVTSEVSPMEMMVLLQKTYQVIESREDSNCQIYINALTSSTDKIVQKLTDNRAKIVGETVTRFKTF